MQFDYDIDAPFKDRTLQTPVDTENGIPLNDLSVEAHNEAKNFAFSKISIVPISLSSKILEFLSSHKQRFAPPRKRRQSQTRVFINSSASFSIKAQGFKGLGSTEKRSKSSS